MPGLRSRRIILQQDNARPLTARIVRAFLVEEDVTLLPWPAVSPDLSPIEHVWDEMERRVRAQPQQPENLDELRRALLTVWQHIPKTLVFPGSSGQLHEAQMHSCNQCPWWTHRVMTIVNLVITPIV